MIWPDLAEVKIFGQKPLAITENFIWSLDGGMYTQPFASRAEARGVLLGSEKMTMLSTGEPEFSRHFSECSAALVRNRATGMVSLIHESLWSDSASAALALQRRDNLDVITISEPQRGIPFNRIQRVHEKMLPAQLFDILKPMYDKHISDRVQQTGGYSFLLGLTKSDIEKMYDEAVNASRVGTTKHIADIKIPLAGRDGWDLLYRPEEDIIWVYEPGAKRLFKYKGFNNQNFIQKYLM